MKLPIVVTGPHPQYIEVARSFRGTDRVFSAWCPLFPDHRSTGRTREEALASHTAYLQNLDKATSDDVTFHEIDAPEPK